MTKHRVSSAYFRLALISLILRLQLAIAFIPARVRPGAPTAGVVWVGGGEEERDGGSKRSKKHELDLSFVLAENKPPLIMHIKAMCTFPLFARPKFSQNYLFDSLFALIALFSFFFYFGFFTDGQKKNRPTSWYC